MDKKIAVGLGNNIDYEIQWNKRVVEEQIRVLGIRDKEISCISRIKNLKDLVISILFHMRNDTGGEFYCEKIEDLLAFADLFQIKVTLGGTSVRAAVAMDKLGIPSFAHLVTNNRDVQRLLPESCSWICSNEQESCYPHLIIQYPKECAIEANDIRISTSRPNRLIYVHDPDNENMLLDPRLSCRLANTDILLLSGFNSIHDRSLLKKRLIELRSVMDLLPGRARVFYEDACFHYKGFDELVREYLEDRIQIYSMNEDELQNYSGCRISLLDPQSVYGAIRIFGESIRVPHVVVHSRFWAILYGNNPKEFLSALEGGITMATTRFRCGDQFDKEDYWETGQLEPEKAGMDFAEEFNRQFGEKAVCVPSFEVKKKDVTTIGLGDAFVGGFLPALLK
jgi:hypothetical protein